MSNLRDADLSQLDLRENSLAESGDWVLVKDVRKEKRTIKLAEKREAKKADVASEQPLHMTAAPVAVVVEEHEVKAAEPKPKPKKSNSIHIGNEAELVDLLKQIVTNDPHQSLQLSAMSNRLQDVTRQPWNKKFKASYGSMKDFIKKYPGTFSIDDTTDKVSLAPPPTPVVASKPAKSSLSKSAAAAPKAPNAAAKAAAPVPVAAPAAAAPVAAPAAAASKQPAAKPAALVKAGNSNKAKEGKAGKGSQEGSQEGGADEAPVLFIIVLVALLAAGGLLASGVLDIGKLKALMAK